MSAEPVTARLTDWRRIALAVGPGLVVMLADTDAGSVITASQSGAAYGYRLVLPQLLAIPLLYATQELTIRLGIGTGLGFAALLQRRFGKGVARVALALLVVSCFGALVTQLGALGGLAESFGLPAPAAVAAAVAFFIAVVTLGAYQSVERVAILFGLAELAFLIVAWRAGPDAHQMARQMREAPFGDAGYLYLLAANIGTTFMPWGAFYQQSAIIDKGVERRDLSGSRWETLGGAALCQIVTAAMVIAAAATVGHGAGGARFDTVGDIAGAFSDVLGPALGRGLFAIGLIGSALVAAMVVSLTVAWAAGETMGVNHSLEHRPREAPGFYAAFVALMVSAGLFVAVGIDPLRLSVAVGVVNALMLPLVLAGLYVLARLELRGGPLALRGGYAWTLALLFAGLGAAALYSGLAGAIG